MGLSATALDMSWVMKSFMLKVSEAKRLARTSYNFTTSILAYLSYS